MDQAAADKVKQIRERLDSLNPPDTVYWSRAKSDIEWLLSQLSASEERVRDSFNEGILAAANRLGELMLHSPKHDRELLINAVLELRRQKEAKSLLPSPPQVIRG